MTARPQDVALLPLPKWVSDPIIGHLLSDVDREFCEQYATAYARANVTAALASAQAREDELRAEGVRIERENREGWKQAAHWRGRAERLAEALRDLFDDYKRLADSGDAGFWKLEDTYAGKKALAALSTNASTQTGETT